MIGEVIYKCPTCGSYEIADFDRWWLYSSLKGLAIIGVRFADGNIIFKVSDRVMSADEAIFLEMMSDFFVGRATGGDLD